MAIPNKEEFLRDYWEYYLYLENKVLETKQYVEFSKLNYKVYSKEYVSLLLLLLSEADKLFKVICECFGEQKKQIPGYRKVLNDNYSNKRLKEKVEFLIDLGDLYPFSGIVSDKSPRWWEEANRVKHNRVDNYKMANLKNVLTALACVYKLNCMLLELINGEKHFDVQKSALFKIPKGFSQNSGLVFRTSH